MTVRREEPSLIDTPGAVARPMALLLEKLEACFCELEALSRRQESVLGAGDATLLLDHIGCRQRVIDRVAAAIQELEPLRRAWAKAAGGATPQQRRDIDGRLDALAGTAAAIAQRDQADQARLARKRDELAAQLADLGRSRSAVGAYSPRPGGAPGLQDREA